MHLKEISSFNTAYIFDFDSNISYTLFFQKKACNNDMRFNLRVCVHRHDIWAVLGFVLYSSVPHNRLSLGNCLQQYQAGLCNTMQLSESDIAMPYLGTLRQHAFLCQLPYFTRLKHFVFNLNSLNPTFF